MAHDDGTYHLSALSGGCLFVQSKFTLIFFAGRFNIIDKTFIFIIHFLIAKKHSLKVTTAPCSYIVYMRSRAVTSGLSVSCYLILLCEKTCGSKPVST